MNNREIKKLIKGYVKAILSRNREPKPIEE
jgi:hypothetical protein